MTFSSKLQKLRKDNNLSQEQLASELCVSRQAISKWELGTLPDINNLVKISNFFDCSLDYLMNDDKEDQFEEEFSNEQNKIANNENVGTKATAIKRHLKFILPGSGMAISIIFLILIKLISTFFPTPIARQAESGIWYTGFIGFIDYYDLYGIVNIALLLFMLSFTFFSFFIVKKKNKSKKNILLTLIGYAMIMIFCIKSLYEINTKPFVSLNFLELVISIIYIACAILLFSREIKD